SPTCARRDAATPSRTTSNARRAKGRKLSPSAVSRMRRARTKSAPPTASSRARMRALTAGCPSRSATAARLKLPSRATRSKAASWSRCNIESLDGNYCCHRLDAYHGGAYAARMIRLATPEDGAALAAIYDPIVANTAISFETDPPGAAEIGRRVGSVLQHAPWLVDDDGGVRGYAYASRHRERAAYVWSVDAAVYLVEASPR